MELLFFIAIGAIFAAISMVLPPVGGEAERDLNKHTFIPLGPLHHS